MLERKGRVKEEGNEKGVYIKVVREEMVLVFTWQRKKEGEIKKKNSGKNGVQKWRRRCRRQELYKV